MSRGINGSEHCGNARADWLIPAGAVDSSIVMRDLFPRMVIIAVGVAVPATPPAFSQSWLDQLTPQSRENLLGPSETPPQPGEGTVRPAELAPETPSLPEAATSTRCDLPYLPMAGIYRSIEGPIELSYLNDPVERCPDRIRLVAIESSSPDRLDVALTFTGDSYDGTALYGGAAVLASLTVPIHSGINPNGYTLAREFQLSGVPFASGFVLEARLASEARAPECFCAEIRDERDWANRMREIYSDPLIRDFALRHNLRGQHCEADGRISQYMVGDERHEFLGPPTRTLSYGGREYAYSYDDLVGGVADGTLRIDYVTDEILGSPDFIPTCHELETTPGDRIIASASATTDVHTCEVQLPDYRAIARECLTTVEFAALEAHEGAHAATCRELNAWTHFWIVYANGTRERTTNMFRAIYSQSNAYPVFAGDDEVNAYTAEIAVYDDFLQSYCGPAPAN